MKLVSPSLNSLLLGFGWKIMLKGCPLLTIKRSSSYRSVWWHLLLFSMSRSQCSISRTACRDGDTEHSHEWKIQQPAVACNLKFYSRLQVSSQMINHSSKKMNCSSRSNISDLIHHSCSSHLRLDSQSNKAIVTQRNAAYLGVNNTLHWLNLGPTKLDKNNLFMFTLTHVCRKLLAACTKWQFSCCL